MSHPGPPDDPVLACCELVPPHLTPILATLLSGATDAAAAHQLNMSPRTYSRRLAELLELFGSRTRFQVGLKLGLSARSLPCVASRRASCAGANRSA